MLLRVDRAPDSVSGCEVFLSCVRGVSPVRSEAQRKIQTNTSKPGLGPWISIYSTIIGREAHADNNGGGESRQLA